MARMRMIKPSFFSNDELLSVSPVVRLLFIGLWTIADRRGRFEDRPVRIKVQLLPMDDFDIDAALDQLKREKLILRYEVDGVRYIQIVNFEKHQRPHINETESVIPPRPSIKEGECAALVDAENNQGDAEHLPSTNQGSTKASSYLNSYLNLNPEYVPTESRNSAESRAAKPKSKNLAPVFDAFRAHGIRDPVFVPTSGEGKAAMGLLSKYTADQIACCWEFVSKHGSGWERSHISFGYLARNQVVEHWVNGELKNATNAQNGSGRVAGSAHGGNSQIDSEGEERILRMVARGRQRGLAPPTDPTTENAANGGDRDGAGTLAAGP